MKFYCEKNIYPFKFGASISISRKREREREGETKLLKRANLFHAVHDGGWRGGGIRTGNAFNISFRGNKWKRLDDVGQTFRYRE